MRLARAQDGFTLPDVLIGMVILVVVSLGLMSLTVSLIRGNVFSRQLTAATVLAQDQLEQVKRLGYRDANTAAGTEAYGSMTAYPFYKRVTVVTNDTPAPAIKTVKVTVFWNADARKVDVQTLVAE
jgi:Tfp pilus assembly protein PilV